MCNLLQVVKEKGIKQGLERGIAQGLEQGVEQERINAVKRMLQAGAPKSQIIEFGYTDEEISKAEGERAASIN